MGKIRSLPVELSGPLKDVFRGKQDSLLSFNLSKPVLGTDFTRSGYLMLRREAVLCNRYHKGNKEVYR